MGMTSTAQKPNFWEWYEEDHTKHHACMDRGIQLLANLLETQFSAVKRTFPKEWQIVDDMRDALIWYEEQAAKGVGFAKYRYDYKIRMFRLEDAFNDVLCGKCRKAVDSYLSDAFARDRLQGVE